MTPRSPRKIPSGYGTELRSQMEEDRRRRREEQQRVLDEEREQTRRLDEEAQRQAARRRASEERRNLFAKQEESKREKAAEAWAKAHAEAEEAKRARRRRGTYYSNQRFQESQGFIAADLNSSVESLRGEGTPRRGVGGVASPREGPTPPGGAETAAETASALVSAGVDRQAAKNSEPRMQEQNVVLDTSTTMRSSVTTTNPPLNITNSHAAAAPPAVSIALPHAQQAPFLAASSDTVSAASMLDLRLNMERTLRDEVEKLRVQNKMDEMERKLRELEKLGGAASHRDHQHATSSTGPTSTSSILGTTGNYGHSGTHAEIMATHHTAPFRGPFGNSYYKNAGTAGPAERDHIFCERDHPYAHLAAGAPGNIGRIGMIGENFGHHHYGTTPTATDVHRDADHRSDVLSADVLSSASASGRRQTCRRSTVESAASGAPLAQHGGLSSSRGCASISGKPKPPAKRASKETVSHYRGGSDLGGALPPSAEAVLSTQQAHSSAAVSTLGRDAVLDAGEDPAEEEEDPTAMSAIAASPSERADNSLDVSLECGAGSPHGSGCTEGTFCTEGDQQVMATLVKLVGDMVENKLSSSITSLPGTTSSQVALSAGARGDHPTEESATTKTATGDSSYVSAGSGGGPSSGARSSGAKSEKQHSPASPVEPISLLQSTISPDDSSQALSALDSARSSAQSSAQSPATGNMEERVAKRVAEKVSANVAEKVSADVAEKVSADLADKVVADLAEHVSADVAEKVSADLAGKIVTELAENVSTDLADKVTAGLAEKVTAHLADRLTPGLAERLRPGLCNDEFRATVCARVSENVDQLGATVCERIAESGRELKQKMQALDEGLLVRSEVFDGRLDAFLARLDEKQTALVSAFAEKTAADRERARELERESWSAEKEQERQDRTREEREEMRKHIETLLLAKCTTAAPQDHSALLDRVAEAVDGLQQKMQEMQEEMQEDRETHQRAFGELEKNSPSQVNLFPVESLVARFAALEAELAVESRNEAVRELQDKTAGLLELQREAQGSLRELLEAQRQAQRGAAALGAAVLCESEANNYLRKKCRDTPRVAVVACFLLLLLGGWVAMFLYVGAAGRRVVLTARDLL